MLPDINLNYFNSKDKIVGTSVNSIQVGVSIPLLFFNNSAKISESKINIKIAENRAFYVSKQLEYKYIKLKEELKKIDAQLQYFSKDGQHLVSEILKTANLSYKNGEIDFYQYIQSIESANQLTVNYLNQLNLYNQIVLDINYLNLN